MGIVFAMGYMVVAGVILLPLALWLEKWLQS